MKLAKKHNLKVMEDNAECYLGTYKGRLSGTIGDCASFSLQVQSILLLVKVVLS